MSRPKLSVPNQCAALGGSSRCTGSSASGLTVPSQGAASATNVITAEDQRCRRPPSDGGAGSRRRAISPGAASTAGQVVTARSAVRATSGILVDLGHRQADADLGQLEHGLQPLDHLVGEGAVGLAAHEVETWLVLRDVDHDPHRRQQRVGAPLAGQVVLGGARREHLDDDDGILDPGPLALARAAAHEQLGIHRGVARPAHDLEVGGVHRARPAAQRVPQQNDEVHAQTVVVLGAARSSSGRGRRGTRSARAGRPPSRGTRPAWSEPSGRCWPWRRFQRVNSGCAGRAAGRGCRSRG